jgi:hypothetical protein
VICCRGAGGVENGGQVRRGGGGGGVERLGEQAGAAPPSRAPAAVQHCGISVDVPAPSPRRAGPA